jgi:hypothetical protein
MVLEFNKGNIALIKYRLIQLEIILCKVNFSENISENYRPKLVNTL